MLTFPRDLMSLCNVVSVQFWPVQRQELSRTTAGRSQGKDLGPPVWRGSFTTAPVRHADAGDIEAALLSLRGVINPFEAYDRRNAFPRAHRDGNFSDTGLIADLGVDNKSLRLTGLDVGFQLLPGDYISFDFGTPQARALHRVLEPAVADGVGATDYFEVFPHIEPGAVTGTAVRLKRPSCYMTLDPGLSPPSINAMVTSSVTFSGVQIL